MLQELPWITDGFTDAELDATYSLAELAKTDVDIFSTAINTPWLTDGISYQEGRAIENLSRLAARQPDAAAALLRMPFLESVEIVDYLAIRALAELAEIQVDENNETAKIFQRIWGHPIIQDGIDDVDAKAVAMLVGASQSDYLREKVELPDPEQVEVEQRIITLPLTGQTTITIIRFSYARLSRAMNVVENVLRMLEEFMSSPLPQSEVSYIFGTNGPGGGYNATDYVYIRFGELLEHCIAYEDDCLIVHEAAHYYWRGQPWMSEGAATFIPNVFRSVKEGAPVYPNSNFCHGVRNISELVSLETKSGSPSWMCNYELGSLLFHDLYRNMDETAFRTGFRQLYQLSWFDPEGECRGTHHNICRVRAAFTKGIPAVDAAAAEKVIDKWYWGDQPRFWEGEVSPFIRGVVLGNDGMPLEGIIVTAQSAHSVSGVGSVWWGIEESIGGGIGSGSNGEFEIGAPVGAYELSAELPQACGADRMWYDGEGLTSDREKAVVIEVDGSPIDPITVSVPISSDDPNCGAWMIRGTVIGADGKPGLHGTWRGPIYALVPHEGRRVAWFDIWEREGVVPNPEGAFELLVQDGKYYLRMVLCEDYYCEDIVELWYDGQWASMDKTRAVEIVVDGGDVKGIEIKIPPLE